MTAIKVGIARPIEILPEETNRFFCPARPFTAPNSRLTYFANAGHNASLEDVAQFNAVLLAHLAHHAAA